MMLAVQASLLFTAACSEDFAGPEPEGAAALLSVQPAPGSVGVDAGTSVVVRFDHPVAAGMEAYAALHEGDLLGPEVPGTWVMSEDHATLIFTPDHPFKASTTYVIHIGGGMMDDHGNLVDLGHHGLGMGGQWATGSMMAGGMMGGQNHHMGEGWRHPTNGSYGMVFSFSTA
jgi:hypothetical protein